MTIFHCCCCPAAAAALLLLFSRCRELSWLVSLRVSLLLLAERLRPGLRLQTTRAHRAARHGAWGRCGTALLVKRDRKGGPALGTWSLCGCGLVRSAAATLTEGGVQAQPPTPSATPGCCGLLPERPVRAPRVRLAREHCVPLRGRSHKLDSARVQDKQAEAKAVLQWAEQARADQPENQGLTAADWSDRRDKIKAAQKTIAHYDGTFFAMVQD